MLAVQHPQYATGFPCCYKSSLRHVPQYIVVDKVSQCCHVLSQTVDKVVELADDETPLADVESHKILVHLFEEGVIIAALTWNAPIAASPRLVAEDHSPKGTVEEIILVELAGGEGC